MPRTNTLDLRDTSMANLIELDAAIGNELDAFRHGDTFVTFEQWSQLLADRRQLRARMDELRSGVIVPRV